MKLEESGVVRLQQSMAQACSAKLAGNYNYTVHSLVYLSLHGLDVPTLCSMPTFLGAYPATAPAQSVSHRHSERAM